MKKLLNTTLLFCMFFPLLAFADGWDEQQYREIEQSIRLPQFAAQDFPITKYGAKSGNTAKKL